MKIVRNLFLAFAVLSCVATQVRGMEDFLLAKARGSRMVERFFCAGRGKARRCELREIKYSSEYACRDGRSSVLREIKYYFKHECRDGSSVEVTITGEGNLNLWAKDLTAFVEFKPCDKNLTTEDLQSILQRIIADGMSENVIELYLFGNSLTELPAEIGGLINLRKLVLYYNQLTPEAIANILRLLPQLEELNLSCNQLTELPEEIGRPASLRKLDLSCNRLTQEAIANIPRLLPQLEELNLSCNQLTELLSGMAELRSLRKLNLSSNQLISVGIANILRWLPQELEELKLSWNNLTFLPEEIGGLTSLRTLNLSWNKLRELPAEIYNLEKLTTFSIISNNLLRELPAEIGPMVGNSRCIGLYSVPRRSSGIERSARPKTR